MNLTEVIIKIAANLVKKAEANTSFNESVPAVSQPVNNGVTSDAQVSGQAAQVPADQSQMAAAQAAPVATDPNAGMPDPGMEGAMAAQSFLAPIMEAAMNGDPNAQNIIANAAGMIAKGVALAAAESMGGGEMVPPDVAASQAVSPEAVAADKIVPAKDDKTVVPPKGEEDTVKTSSFKAALLKLLANDNNI